MTSHDPEKSPRNDENVVKNVDKNVTKSVDKNVTKSVDKDVETNVIKNAVRNDSHFGGMPLGQTVMAPRDK